MEGILYHCREKEFIDENSKEGETFSLESDAFGEEKLGDSQ